MAEAETGGGPSKPEVQSEDFLLLDVTVPKALYDAQAAGTLSTPVPVLLWIHGGAYTAGSKDEVNPAGLIQQSRRNGEPGIVFVTINYRARPLRLPSRKPWMRDISSNAGLYEQRLAMEWLRYNIRRFGGDPNYITVIGESAGAGSILSHLSVFGGIDGTSPFKRAILQSPAIKPAQDAALNIQLFDQLLATSNTSSYAELRQLSAERLMDINIAMVGAAPFASFLFGPNVDSILIPSHPSPLLTHRKVDTSVSVLVAHNPDEGLLFTDPRIANQSAFEAYLAGFMPSVPSLPLSKIKHLSEVIYPADFTGSVLPYTNQVGRTKLAIAGGLVDCFSFGVHLAYANSLRGYQVSRFPGIHAMDVGYTFWNGEGNDGFGVPIPAETAVRMQRWFVDFAMEGFAGLEGPAGLPIYGEGASVVNVTGSGFPVVRDPAANERCKFWLEGLFG
ncbi:hypothetical protein VTI74DRAFT_4821 [Chaetomium olivicolor]